MKYFKELTFLLVIFMAQAMAQWQRCVGSPWLATCSPHGSWGRGGRGCRSRVLWWYDRHLRSCRQMWYLGCGGNSNRWCSQQECLQRCRR
ncbi:male accessory gland serine protease inhibitor-like [Lucilia cuprina]|uniref:male accessory gland serine protease inhibitor-like n=1 Tax=Lucilia cuprina TaxID=7375 RepID=UPI001F060D01|nr:male accessory gland serine protease inhibitor-like [Lucilia cuprina]